MLIQSFRLQVLIALAGIVLAGSSRVLAGDERWVRHYQGGEISALDRALELVVHPSGEITVVGWSCNDLFVLRLDENGKELWSQLEPEDFYYAWIVKAISSGEDVIVSATYTYPYYGHSADTYRYSRFGDTVWEQGSSLVIWALADDATGGAFQAGHFFNDLGKSPGFLRQIANDGQNVWFDLVVPADFPEQFFSGSLDVLAIQDSSYVYAAGPVHGPTVHRQLLVKYDLAGELQWEHYVLPENDSAVVTWIGPASDGTVAVAGLDSTGVWLGRRGSDGEQLWMKSLPDRPSLAADPEGVVYSVASITGQSGGTDIRLTAISRDGVDLWEAIHDSGPGTADVPAVMAIAGDGTIVLLATNENQVLLLRYDPAGQLQSTQTLGFPPPIGTSLALDLVGERAFALGGVARGDCCDMSSDFYVAAYDQGGTGPHVWAEVDHPMTPLFSRGDEAQVGSGGSVTAWIQTEYKCASALNLVHCDSNGHLGWSRVHPEAGIACFHPSGESTVGCKRGEAIQLVRYDEEGSLIWNRSFESLVDFVPDGLADGLAAGLDGGVVLFDVMASRTLVIAIDAIGVERWRRLLQGFRAGAVTEGPDGRVYLRGWNEQSVPRIYALTVKGDIEWTRTTGGAEVMRPLDFIAAEGGVLSITGYVRHTGSQDWETWQLGPDGSTRWVATEPGGAGSFQNQPIRVRNHPAGGVVVAGTMVGITSDALVVRYDDQGAVMWRSGLDTERDERCSDMAVDAAGNALVTMAMGQEVRTIKYGQDGALIWSRDYREDVGVTGPMAIGVGPDLSVAVVGMAGSDSAFVIKYEGLTPVEIAGFMAVRDGEDVLVSWEVGAGLIPLGFNVFHGSSPERIADQINPERIPGEARNFVHHGVPSGAAYYVLEVLELDGGSMRHGPVLATAAGSPPIFWATGPYPNPTQDAVEWEVGLPARTHVRLIVHDASGRRVAQVVDELLPAGVHRIPWDGRPDRGPRSPAGIYFYRLVADRETRSGKLVLSPRR